MTDLKNGIIEIDGFEFRPGVKDEDVLIYFADKARVLELASGRKVKFTKPFYLADDIYSYAFNFNQDGLLSHFSLIPEVPSYVIDHGYGEQTKYKLEISKKWLKGMIDDSPASESDESILYSFAWGYIRSATRDDIHYGLVGGEIDVVIRDGD